MVIIWFHSLYGKIDDNLSTNSGQLFISHNLLKYLTQLFINNGVCVCVCVTVCDGRFVCASMFRNRVPLLMRYTFHCGSAELTTEMPMQNKYGIEIIWFALGCVYLLDSKWDFFFNSMTSVKWMSNSLVVIWPIGQFSFARAYMWMYVCVRARQTNTKITIQISIKSELTDLFLLASLVVVVVVVRFVRIHSDPAPNILGYFGFDFVLQFHLIGCTLFQFFSMSSYRF